jgi:hypothetical protein
MTDNSRKILPPIQPTRWSGSLITEVLRKRILSQQLRKVTAHLTESSVTGSLISLRSTSRLRVLLEPHLWLRRLLHPYRPDRLGTTTTHFHASRSRNPRLDGVCGCMNRRSRPSPPRFIDASAAQRSRPNQASQELLNTNHIGEFETEQRSVTSCITPVSGAGFAGSGIDYTNDYAHGGRSNLRRPSTLITSVKKASNAEHAIPEGCDSSGNPTQLAGC